MFSFRLEVAVFSHLLTKSSSYVGVGNMNNSTQKKKTDNQPWNQAPKGQTHVKAKLLNLKHMSRPSFIYLDLLNAVFEHMWSPQKSFDHVKDSTHNQCKNFGPCVILLNWTVVHEWYILLFARKNRHPIDISYTISIGLREWHMAIKQRTCGNVPIHLLTHHLSTYLCTCPFISLLWLQWPRLKASKR